MKTEIVSINDESLNKFPRLWRHKDSGNVWLQLENAAVLLSRQGNPIDGYAILKSEALEWPEYSYERITTPVTINFIP